MPRITTDGEGLMLLLWDLLSVMENNLPLDLTMDSFRRYEKKKKWGWGEKEVNLKRIKAHLVIRRILFFMSLPSILYFLMFVNIDDFQ